jgi:hypothetical protein
LSLIQDHSSWEVVVNTPASIVEALDIEHSFAPVVNPFRIGAPA